ncbi:MAG: phosphoribosylglycinamide formyltransferase [Spirochaetota bacterium]
MSGRKLRIGVLGSTRGTDLQAVIDAIETGRLRAEIVAVISNKQKAGILQKAGRYNIPAYYMPMRSESGQKLPRRDYDQNIDTVLKQQEVDLVLLIGYMRIVSPWLCKRWEGRMLNVHPSLLPDFAGLADGSVHEAVLSEGRQESGCTVHLVSAEVDAGRIILQKRTPVFPEDTPQTLKQRIQLLEGEALVEVIEGFAGTY